MCLGCCAAMAQRKGELLRLETLERIASLLGDLRQAAAAAGLEEDATADEAGVPA